MNEQLLSNNRTAPQLGLVPNVPPQLPNYPLEDSAPVDAIQPTIYLHNEPIWEYASTVVPVEQSAKETDAMLNELGKLGWELCEALVVESNVRYHFKRLQPVSTSTLEER